MAQNVGKIPFFFKIKHFFRLPRGRKGGKNPDKKRFLISG